MTSIVIRDDVRRFLILAGRPADLYGARARSSSASACSPDQQTNEKARNEQ
jgi:hypothetical protein